MSRIGKKPVQIPDGVTISISKDNQVTVKGPKGELKEAIDRDITVEIKDKEVEFYVLQTRSVTVQCMVCIGL